MGILAGKRVLVVGLGKSGLQATRLCAKEGARLVANDVRAELPDADRDALASLGATLVLGGHPESALDGVDQVVVSPGVPGNALLDAAAARGIPVASEIELASWTLDPGATVIAVTGTNGKSTVTTLVGEMAKRTGRPTFVGGNLGTPLVDVAGTDAAGRGGIVVVEVSSFQLERVDRFRPHVAVLLNVTDDHLDRHGTFAAYAAAKARVFHAQGAGDHAVVPAGDAIVLPLARAGRAAVHTFGGTDGEVRVIDGELRDTAGALSLPVSALKIRGAHNVDNACAAALAARLAGIPTEHVREVLSTFAGLPHRMALVRERGGVAYYDDSKATNVGATVAALLGIRDVHAKVVLIAGGVDKGGSYAPVAERMRAQGRAAVLIGAAAPLIEAALAGAGIPLAPATTIDDAVTKAAALAAPGDAVLLAPACASFDMFRSYAHRGDEFVRAVRSLPEVSHAA